MARKRGVSPAPDQTLNHWDSWKACQERFSQHGYDVRIEVDRGHLEVTSWSGEVTYVPPPTTYTATATDHRGVEYHVSSKDPLAAVQALEDRLNLRPNPSSTDPFDQLMEVFRG